MTSERIEPTVQFVKEALLAVPSFLCCALEKVSMSTQTELTFNERFRPQFHYSPQTGWVNDPNGLVYYQGEYHLFFQYVLDSRRLGPEHWGHAVSSDLVHWTHLPIALYPDQLGAIWSGSAVVDQQNTSGLVPGGGLVALYSYQNQSQGLAYSLDKGRTWTKHPDNPIIPIGGKDFRDPKVFWHPGENRWIMVLAAGRVLKILASPDLIKWTQVSEFKDPHMPGAVFECPDLFPMQLDGQTKWVLSLSVWGAGPLDAHGSIYLVGQFDGKSFHNETLTPYWLDYGPDNYAAITFNNMPIDERIMLGWMGNWAYGTKNPTSPWRGVMTIPRKLELKRFADDIRLIQNPVAQVETLHTNVRSWHDLQLLADNNLLAEVSGKTLDILAEFELGSATSFGFRVHQNSTKTEFTTIGYDVANSKLIVDRTKSGDTSFHESFSTRDKVLMPPVGNKIKMRILVDWSSVEIFGNNGEIALSYQVFPDDASDKLELFVSGGDVRLVALTISAIKGVWQ